MSKRNMHGETLEEFMANVDKLISQTLYGLTSSDLADTRKTEEVNHETIPR